MTYKSKSTINRVAAGLLASTMALSVFALSPSQTGSLTFPVANAEAVKVDAPQTPGFAGVVKAVSPAVVSVRVEQIAQPASDDGEFRFDRRFGGDRGLPDFFKNNPDIFKRFFGAPDGQKGRRHNKRRFGMSQGSGFFISQDGFLVTNNHVVENGSKFTVILNNGTEYDAKLIGADKRSDLAVLKVNADEKFTYVSFSEEEPEIGNWVVAVGNPFGLGGTVTAGIVSARGREIGASRYDDFIQIDAAVNKGNSGGPAFNLKGEVIGVNTAIFSPSGGNVGIAFAIPASTTKEIVDELMSNGSVVRGWLGVQIQPVTKDIAEALNMSKAKGALVTEPQDDSPAQKSGIRSGDVITKVDGKRVRGPKALARIIGEYAPDTKTTLTIVRNGEEKEISVTLGKLGESATAKSDTPAGKAMPKTGKLGLALGKPLEGEGVLVLDVAPESTAEAKGLQEGDVVASVNGEKVSDPDQVAKLVEEAEQAGRKSTLFQIQRDGANRFVAIPFKKG